MDWNALAKYYLDKIPKIYYFPLGNVPPAKPEMYFGK